MHSSRMRTARLRIVPGWREVGGVTFDPGRGGGGGEVVVLSRGKVVDLWCCPPPPPQVEQSE